MLTLRRINHYHKLFTQIKMDFPLLERTPRFILRDRFRKGVYDSLYLTDGKHTLGYLVFDKSDNKAIHILYLAVLKQYRGMGYGTALLRLFKEKTENTTLFLEVENPLEAKNAEEKKTREDRIAFYEKAGFSILEGLTVRLMGVNTLGMTTGGVEVVNMYEESYDRLIGKVLARFVLKVSCEQAKKW